MIIFHFIDGVETQGGQVTWMLKFTVATVFHASGQEEGWECSVWGLVCSFKGGPVTKQTPKYSMNFIDGVRA